MEPRTDPLHLLALTFDDLTAELGRRYGRGRHHAAALLRECYRQGNPAAHTAPEVAASPGLAAALAPDLAFTPGQVEAEHHQDGVVKFVTRLTDGHRIESVLLPMATHRTVCVSSQVGCRMGCRFCETARLGLVRNLTVEEMVGQVYAARQRFGADVRNVVFMGMGEPLDNFENLVQAIRVLNDQRGLDVALRRITVSTCGLAHGIRRLAALDLPQLKLAVSLNAPDDETRSRLMPINRRIPLAPLFAALAEFPLAKDGSIMVAYVLIPGINDGATRAAAIGRRLSPLKARINLIPFNPVREDAYRAPTEEEIEAFTDQLMAAGVFVCRRTTRGRDLMAACGQLGGRADAGPPRRKAVAPGTGLRPPAAAISCRDDRQPAR